MNMYDYAKQMLGARSSLNADATPYAYTELDLPDWIPKVLQKEIKRTHKQDIDRARAKAAARRQDAMMDVHRYGGMSGAIGNQAGLSNAPATLYGQSITASEVAMRSQRSLNEQNRRMQAAIQRQHMIPDLWNQTMLDEFSNQVLKPKEEWKMGNDGTYLDGGVIRMRFPFGEIEMNCCNEAELERAYEMAKHMLKVHEENTATGLVKKNLRENEMAEREPQEAAATPLPPAVYSAV